MTNDKNLPPQRDLAEGGKIRNDSDKIVSLLSEIKKELTEIKERLEKQLVDKKSE